MTPASSTTKTGHHDIVEILLNRQKSNQALLIWVIFRNVNRFEKYNGQYIIDCFKGYKIVDFGYCFRPGIFFYKEYIKT